MRTAALPNPGQWLVVHCDRQCRVSENLITVEAARGILAVFTEEHTTEENLARVGACVARAHGWCQDEITKSVIESTWTCPGCVRRLASEEQGNG